MFKRFGDWCKKWENYIFAFSTFIFGLGVIIYSVVVLVSAVSMAFGEVFGG